MASRFLSSTSRSSHAVLAALLLSGSVVACTSTIVQRESAPPAPADEAGVIDPPMTHPLPEAGTPDTSTGPFVFEPAPSGTFAQAVSFGGSVVKTPKIVPIVFAADASKQQVADFVTKLATTTYWGKISSEYGVGALTAKPAIVLSETAPTSIDDNQIGPWLAAKFSSDAAHFGTPDSSTLYAVFYPDGTTVTQGSGTSCTEFGGYHFETSAGGKSISYAVIPRCASFAGFAGSDVITFASSHEVLEWATDPFPQTRPAYRGVDDDHAVWSRVFLGELGDLCTQMGNVSDIPTDLGFTVQRTWSNAAAKLGHDPCVPATKDAYFQSAPVLSQSVTFTLPASFGGSDVATKGVTIPVGKSKTIEVDLFSDAATSGAWTVSAVDTISRFTRQAPTLDFAWDRTTGVNGEKLHLTVTVKSAASLVTGAHPFSITSTLGKQTVSWPALVVEQ